MAKRILVVDDEPSIRKILATRLAHEGFQVDMAASGREAIGAYIESLEHEPYSVMVLDIRMAGIDGIETLGLIRKEESLRKIKLGTGLPVIVITATTDSLGQSFYAGCDDYLPKPFRPEQLLEKINNILEKREQQ